MSKGFDKINIVSSVYTPYEGTLPKNNFIFHIHITVSEELCGPHRPYFLMKSLNLKP